MNSFLYVFGVPLNDGCIVIIFIGVMKALQCPFLNRIPLNQIRQQAGEILQLADNCPIMGHVLKYTSTTRSGSGHVLSTAAAAVANSNIS